jgi:hypothetical protein
MNVSVGATMPGVVIGTKASGSISEHVNAGFDPHRTLR